MISVLLTLAHPLLVRILISPLSEPRKYVLNPKGLIDSTRLLRYEEDFETIFSKIGTAAFERIRVQID